MSLHPLFALGLLGAGWFGFAFRRTSIGGAAAAFVALQGLLSLGGIAIFASGRKDVADGAVFLWAVAFVGFAAGIASLALGLRQYYAHRTPKWVVNEEIKR